MLAMLLEITSTLVCWACMPVPAMSSARIGVSPYIYVRYGSSGIRVGDLVDGGLLALPFGFDELRRELKRALDVGHAHQFADRLHVAVLDSALEELWRGDRRRRAARVEQAAPLGDHAVGVGGRDNGDF